MTNAATVATQAENTTPPPQPAAPQQRKLVSKFADRLGVEPNRMLSTLKATCFKQKSGDPEVSDEQMMALLIVSDQYGLNPFTREIFAFPDKAKGIVPVVSVDGWSRIINDNPQMDGVEFRYSDTSVTIDDDARPCPEWCEVVITRKDRSQPIVVREYLDEVYRPAYRGTGRDNKEYVTKGPWQTHTKRFLRHKTLIQGARVAFGFAGIYDEDEAVNIRDATPIPVQPIHQEKAEARSTLDTLNGNKKPFVEAEIIDETPAPSNAENKKEALQNKVECAQCNGEGIVDTEGGQKECTACQPAGDGNQSQN